MFLKMLIYILSLDIATTNGEVVELVYGTSLENWRRFVAYRGFESHPLRHFYYIVFAAVEKYSSGEEAPLLRV